MFPFQPGACIPPRPWAQPWTGGPPGTSPCACHLPERRGWPGAEVDLSQRSLGSSCHLGRDKIPRELGLLPASVMCGAQDGAGRALCTWGGPGHPPPALTSKVFFSPQESSTLSPSLSESVQLLRHTWDSRFSFRLDPDSNQTKEWRPLRASVHGPGGAPASNLSRHHTPSIERVWGPPHPTGQSVELEPWAPPSHRHGWLRVALVHLVDYKSCWSKECGLIVTSPTRAQLGHMRPGLCKIKHSPSSDQKHNNF